MNMDIRTQHGLKVVLNNQIRWATSTPREAAETQSVSSLALDGDGDGGGAPPLSLSEAMMRSWTAQVGSRRQLLRSLMVPDGIDEDTPHWDGSLECCTPGRPPGVRLTYKGVCHLMRYVGGVAATHVHRDREEIPRGAVVVDIDEGVHGSYAAVKDLHALAKGGTHGWQQQYEGVAQAWVDAPLQAVQHAATSASAVELGIGLGTGVPLAGLAWRAAREGYESIGETRENGARLAARGKVLAQRTEDLHHIMRHVNMYPLDAPMGVLGDVAARSLLTQGRMQNDVKQAEQHNRMSGRIGWASLASGSSILAKVGVAAPMSAGMAIASAAAGHGVAGTGAFIAQNAAAGVAATVGGIATTALSIPAAAGAIGMGALFTKKSIDQRNEYRQRNLPTRLKVHDLKRDFAPEPVSAKDARTRRYCDFVLAKSDKRRSFYRHFSRMNIGFLGGSTMYGMGALGTGVAIAVAAAAGLSNPIGWGVLTALGTIGGVLMLANSLQFLRGHHKQQRYDAYLERDDPELDREFLAGVDIMLPGNDQEASKRRGLDLRGRFYDMITRRDGHRESLLRSIAADAGHYHATPVRCEDDAMTRNEKQTMAPTLVKRLSALLFTRGGRFLPWRRNSYDLRTATADMRAKGARTYTALSSDDVKRWLGNRDHYAEQVIYMSRALGEQSNYLRHKLALRQHILESTTPEGREALALAERPGVEIGTPGWFELEAARGAARFLQRQDEGLERDSLMLSEVMLLERELSQSRREGPPPRDRMAVLKERFMCAAGGNPYNPVVGKVVSEEAVDYSFAKWLHGSKGESDRLRNLRGLLVETEMQATDLNEQLAALHREREILAAEQAVAPVKPATPATPATPVKQVDPVKPADPANPVKRVAPPKPPRRHLMTEPT